MAKMNLGLGGIALMAAGVLLTVGHSVTALNELLLFVHIKKILSNTRRGRSH